MSQSLGHLLHNLPRWTVALEMNQAGQATHKLAAAFSASLRGWALAASSLCWRHLARGRKLSQPFGASGEIKRRSGQDHIVNAQAE